MGAEGTYETELAYFLGDLGGLEGVAPGEVDWWMLYRLIENGVPVSNAVRMRGRVGAAVFDECVIPRSTLALKPSSARLSSSQSERALRVGLVFARAAAAFGNRSRAVMWMSGANRALGGAAPADLLRNEPGARYVEELLGRLEHGIAA